MDRGCRRENGQCGTGQQLEKWTRHGVAFNYPYLQWGLLCNWTTQPAVPYAIQLQAWEQLGDNCQEKSNKHFFTDKRIGEKALAVILIQVFHPCEPNRQTNDKCDCLSSVKITKSNNFKSKYLIFSPYKHK